MCKSIAEGGARCKGPACPRPAPPEMTDPEEVKSTEQWEKMTAGEQAMFSSSTRAKWDRNLKKKLARANPEAVDLDTGSKLFEREYARVFNDISRPTLHLTEAVIGRLDTVDRKAAALTRPFINRDMKTAEVLTQSRAALRLQEEAIQAEREKIQDPHRRAGRYRGLNDGTEAADMKITLVKDEQDRIQEQATLYGMNTHQYLTRQALNYAADKRQSLAKKSDDGYLQEASQYDGRVDMREHTITMTAQARAEREVWLQLSTKERAELAAGLLKPQQRIERLEKVTRLLQRGNEAVARYQEEIEGYKAILRAGPDEHGKFGGSWTENSLNEKIMFTQDKKATIEAGVRKYSTEREALQATNAQDREARRIAGQNIRTVITAGLQLVGNTRNRAGVAFLTNLVRGVRW